MLIRNSLLVSAACLALVVVGCRGAADPTGAPPSAGGVPTTGAARSPQPVVDLTGLIAAHEMAGVTPEGTARLWIAAAIDVGAGDPTRAAHGLAALGHLTVPFKSASSWERRPSYQTFATRLREAPHIFRSYAVGAEPDNGYAFDGAVVIQVMRTVPAEGERRHALYIRSSGADTPRPIYLEQPTEGGLWYVTTFDSIYAEVRPPVDPTP